MPTIISKTPEQTFRLGKEWAWQAKPGWVIGLSGELGAGKTQLVKGLAAGLEFPGRVHSPTFTLLNQYDGGRLTIFHLDLYRLERPQEIIQAGLEDYLYPSAGLTVIEWVERWFPEFKRGFLSNSPTPYPAHYRQVRMECLNESERRIVYEDIGS